MPKDKNDLSSSKGSDKLNEQVKPDINKGEGKLQDRNYSDKFGNNTTKYITRPQTTSEATPPSKKDE